MTGDVLVGDRPITKPGAEVPADAEVRLRAADSPYVSRGGEKLAGALDAFGLEARDLVALDVGASTGGFTDCLLQRGARRVIALDVGYGQLAWKLRQDARVLVLERTNARTLAPSALPEPADVAVVDVSFISLRTVLPAVVAAVRPGGTIVALVKPQFEVGRGRVGKGGGARGRCSMRCFGRSPTGRAAAARRRLPPAGRGPPAMPPYPRPPARAAGDACSAVRIRSRADVRSCRRSRSSRTHARPRSSTSGRERAARAPRARVRDRGRRRTRASAGCRRARRSAPSRRAPCGRRVSAAAAAPARRTTAPG